MTAVSTPQTLAAGTSRPMQAVQRATVAHEIAMLGFSNVAMLPGLTQSYIVVAGRSGEGKSALIRGCPDLFIINADCASCEVPSKARIWPGLNSGGVPVEPHPDHPNNPDMGTPVEMTWARILEVKAALIQLARDRIPGRPKMVALDTVDLCIDLIQRWLASNGSVESFDKLHGKTAWPDLYEQLVQFAVDLKRAGYGVILVVHLGDKTVHLNENAKEYLRDVPIMSDNLWNQIRRFAEIVACVEMEFKETPKMLEKRGPDGKPFINPQTKKPVLVASNEMLKSKKVYLSFASEKLRGIAKTRSGLPDRIFLPKDSGWQAFESAYQKALLQSTQSTPSPQPASNPDAELAAALEGDAASA